LRLRGLLGPRFRRGREKRDEGEYY